MQGLEHDSSLSLADFAGSAFGDLIGGDEETPESTDTGDAAGAPPAEHPPETADVAPAPEGTETLTERAGTPPADAAAVPPDDTVVPDADPLADAKPLAYTVNGQERTYDGIKVLGEDGAIIDADHLPDLMRKLGERDHLFETNQAQYHRVQQLEQLSRWITNGPDGKEQTYDGERGLYEMRLQLVRLGVENNAFNTLLSDPEKLVALLVTDEQGKVHFDPDRVEALRIRTQLEQRDSVDAARQQLSQLLQAPAAPQAPDYATVGPSIVATAAKEAGVDLSTFTAKDQQFLIAQLPRYVRPVTAEDRDPTRPLGSPIVDRSFVDVVKHQAEIRAEQRAEHARITAEQQKIAAATTTASQQNAAKLAAAARTAPVAASPSKPTNPAPKPSSSDDKWDFLLTNSR